jgi:hypothetical protein
MKSSRIGLRAPTSGALDEELRALNAVIPEKFGLGEVVSTLRIADRRSIMIFRAGVKINFPCGLFYLHSRLTKINRLNDDRLDDYLIYILENT